ncbi:hypothetical protein DFH27DRAFT_607774 [Peziza echinospora]|nr:hypothetical protein DFH27DRAFT_607774 [Peziza echinospora]
MSSCPPPLGPDNDVRAGGERWNLLVKDLTPASGRLADDRIRTIYTNLMPFFHSFHSFLDFVHVFHAGSTTMSVWLPSLGPDNDVILPPPLHLNYSTTQMGTNQLEDWVEFKNQGENRGTYRDFARIAAHWSQVKIGFFNTPNTSWVKENWVAANGRKE